jgi:hypothetical protein
MSQFQKGNQGGPGRPPGRTAASTFFDKIGTEAAEDLLNTVVDAARKGNLRAAEIVLARIWPQRKGRPVQLTLPPVRQASDLVPAQAALLQAIGEGAITPEEGAAVASVLEAQRRSIELADIEKRVGLLEAEFGAKRAA